MKIIHSRDMEFVPASHEDPKNPGVVKKVIVQRGEVRSGTMKMINWAKLPVGKSFQAHYHEDMDEVYVILSGRGEMTVESEREIVEAGDRIIIPTGQIHIMKNVGETDIEFLAIGVSGDKDGKTVLV